MRNVRPRRKQVTTLFVTGDFGILMQDSFPLEEPLEALLGLQVQCACGTFSPHAS